MMLNPYRFGAQVAGAAMSADGVGNLQALVNQSPSEALMSFDGASVVQMGGAQVIGAAMSADGQAAPSLVGASLAGVALDAQGASTVQAEVVDRGIAFSADGAATVTFAGMSIASAAMSADGAAVLTASNDFYQVDAADFDPAGSYMAKGPLTGIADAKSGTVSLWLRLDGSDGSELGLISGATDFIGSSVRFLCYRITANTLRVEARNAAGTLILRMTTSTTYLASSTWIHLLASWDLAAAAGQLYINDVDRLAAGATLTNDTIDYTLSNWAIGAETGNGAGIVDACLAEVWFAPGTYIDLSVASNRRKFIKGTGKPEGLGADGSTPTGSAPIDYHHLDDGEAVTNFAVNRGTGGNFGITGSLATCSSSPSD